MVAVMVLWVTVFAFPTPDHFHGINGGSLLIAAMLKPLLHSVDRNIFRSIAIHMFCICHLVLLHELLHGSRECHHIAHVYSPFVIRPSLRRSQGNNQTSTYFFCCIQRSPLYRLSCDKQSNTHQRLNSLSEISISHAALAQRLWLGLLVI